MRDLSFNYNGAVLHRLFWANMRPPEENNQPDELLRALIEENFLNFKAFVDEFSAAAVGVEGSGWAVLWKDMDNNLSIGQLEKHNLLALNGNSPILVLDVWEHAYYLDYLNDRSSYVTKWWQVVNWQDVNKRVWK
jgi:Fe-Mn family superoxide dismutase